MAQDYVVLDIADSEIRLADVRRVGNLFEATALARGEADPLFFKSDVDKNVESQSENISALLAKNSVFKRDISIVIPDSYTYSRFIEMPKLNEKELLSAVKYQADQFIPMPLEETNIDIEIVHEDLDARKNLALIVAAPKKIIQKIERCVERAGLAPIAIETEISAAGRLFSSIFKPQESLNNSGYLFVNFGSQTTSIYFFDISKNILVYSHNFAIGYSLFIKEIQVNLNVDRPKAEELLKTFGITPNSSYHLEAILAPAIKDFLTEVQHSTTLITSTFKKQIQGVYLFNNTPKFHGFDILVGKYLAIPSATLSIASFFTKNNISNLHRDDMPYFVPAIGGNLT